MRARDWRWPGASVALLSALWWWPVTAAAQSESAPATQSESAPATQSASAPAAPSTSAPVDLAVPAIAAPAEQPPDPRPVAVAKKQPRPGQRLDVVKMTAIAFTGGAAATVIAVPAALLAGSLIGALPPNLIAAVLPAVLIAGLLPPVVVAGSEWLLQAWLGSEVGTFWWAWGATTLVHIGALVGGALLGVSTSNAVTLAGLVGVETLLLPTTATAALLLTRSEVESEK